jgi:thioesterase domain-containing protein
MTSGKCSLLPRFAALPNGIMSSPRPPDTAARVLTDYLREKIPLTRAMGMQVAETGERLVLEAPLDANVNHLGTAFGGSLHALPTLACYAVLWTLLNEAGIDCHVVIKHSSANYLQPVKGALRAVCLRPSPEVAAQFIDDLRRKKKARMTLTAVVEGTNGKPAVEFTGEFVALL